MYLKNQMKLYAAVTLSVYPPTLDYSKKVSVIDKRLFQRIS